MMVKNNVPFLDSVAPYIGAGKGLVSVFRLALASFVSNNPLVFCRNHICDIRLLDGLVSCSWLPAEYGAFSSGRI